MASFDCCTEAAIPLREACRILGKSYMTIHKWASEGFHGIVLKTFRIGRNRYTTNAHIQAFVTAMNERRENDQ